MSVESEMSSYNAGAAGGLYTGNSTTDLAAYNAGAASRSGAGAAGGGGGAMVALIPLMLASIPALAIGTCIFPLAGILTLVGTSLIAGVLPDNVGFWVMIMVVLLPGFFIFVLGLKLERVLEQHRWYRRLRHGARLLVVGFVAHVIAFAFNGAGRYGAQVDFFDRITLPHVIAVTAAVVSAHFLFRRLDRKFGDAATFSKRFTFRRTA
ncbi:hypothetical protein ACQW02_17125 [Humitalea sp. 24SJ18S-53]|uniref:hypothetical protein n=1 Tax=Humitalea sp. 24SJ18S-53 TaxID=3422307 RepID=UPI003D672455